MCAFLDHSLLLLLILNRLLLECVFDHQLVPVLGTYNWYQIQYSVKLIQMVFTVGVIFIFVVVQA